MNNFKKILLEIARARVGGSFTIGPTFKNTVEKFLKDNKIKYDNYVSHGDRASYSYDILDVDVKVFDKVIKDLEKMKVKIISSKRSGK